jgi:hypothetical protein
VQLHVSVQIEFLTKIVRLKYTHDVKFDHQQQARRALRAGTTRLRSPTAVLGLESWHGMAWLGSRAYALACHARVMRGGTNDHVFQSELLNFLDRMMSV